MPCCVCSVVLMAAAGMTVVMRICWYDTFGVVCPGNGSCCWLLVFGGLPLQLSKQDQTLTEVCVCVCFATEC